MSSEPFAVRWVKKKVQQRESPTLERADPNTTTAMAPIARGGANQYADHGVVVIVTPYGTAALISQEISRRGYKVVAVWTKDFAEEMKLHIPEKCKDLEYFAELTQANDDSVEDVIQSIRQVAGDFPVVACLAGGEAGVDFADALSEKMGVLTNGTDIPNRRDKKLQQELVRDVGLRSVRQAGGDCLDDVIDFLKSEEYPVVVKPVESAGSDGVKLCHTFEEATEHFNLLMENYEMVNGGECPSVLCQEFLKGKEYVVDHVSRDGVHKTTMVWVYDKRPANGSAFVYFGCIPVDSESPEAKIVIPYVRGVLDALGLKNGPSHGEVMMTPDGPCLVEMNCRAHGGDGNWVPLARALTGGYSQVDASVDAYLEPETFMALPDKPPSPFLASGQEVIFVSYSEGTIKSMPGYEVIKQLPSFVSLQCCVRVGGRAEYTVDLGTTPGGVILINQDENVLKKDVEFCRYMEQINGFFAYETKVEALKRPRGDSVCLEPVSELAVTSGSQKSHRRVFSSDGPSLIRIASNDRPELRGPLVKRMTTVDASKEIVVVVNPYSTGYLVMKEILNRTYQVITLWTKDFPKEMKSHVPLDCTNIKMLHQVQEGDTLADTVEQLYKAAGQFRIVACIAGGELGVELTDALSERLEVRTNGTSVPNRRDKKVQQDLAKAAGLRAVRQVAGASLAEVEEFLLAETYPIVVKPIESSGVDGVKLCHNVEEAKEHCKYLLTTQPAVLCQEFLRGKEYVLDHVSRDGVHKTLMIWEYQKRPANGAASVYFGSVPVDPESSDAKILIPYMRQVLDAVGVKNGPTHGEVIMTPNGPCLIEVKCRTHGGDGSWRPLTRALTGGHTQVEATVNAYLDKQQFYTLPEVPPSPLKAAGQEVILVSFSRGKVKSTPGFDVIKELQSFVYLETGVKVGSEVDYTVDLFTGLGSVMLMHPDKDILEADVAKIRQMEKDNELFEYEEYGHIIRSGSRLRLSESMLTGVEQRFYASDRTDLY